MLHIYQISSVINLWRCFNHSSAGSYLFVSHTGFGGVSYAMAITCLLLQPGQNFTATPTTNSSTLEEDDSPSGACDEEALSMGDYRDILSLIRVLSHGPQSKSDVDGIVELYVINQSLLRILSL